MRIETITPATEQPVTLAEVKDHCVVGGDDDDSLLSLYLATAAQWAETYLNQSIMTQTLKVFLDAFPSGPFTLPRGPVQSVSSIKYIKAATGLENTLAASAWTLHGSRLSPAFGRSWPQARETLDAVRVEYVAGYTAASVVPAVIKQAVLLRVGQHYFQREEIQAGMFRPATVTSERLLDTIRERQVS